MSAAHKVVIINGSVANDPLGKPAAIKVDAKKIMGWDPTGSRSEKSLCINLSFYTYAGKDNKDTLWDDLFSARGDKRNRFSGQRYFRPGDIQGRGEYEASGTVYVGLLCAGRSGQNGGGFRYV